MKEEEDEWEPVVVDPYMTEDVGMPIKDQLELMPTSLEETGGPAKRPPASQKRKDVAAASSAASKRRRLTCKTSPGYEEEEEEEAPQVSGSRSLASSAVKDKKRCLQSGVTGVVYLSGSDRWRATFRGTRKYFATEKYKTGSNTWSEAERLAMQAAIRARRNLEVRLCAKVREQSAEKESSCPTAAERVQALIGAEDRYYVHRGAFVAQLQTKFDQIRLTPVHPKGSGVKDVEKAKKLALQSIANFKKELQSGTSVEHALASVREARLREHYCSMARAKASTTEADRVQALIAAKGGCYLNSSGAFVVEIQTKFGRLSLPTVRPKGSGNKVARARKVALQNIRDFKDSLRAGTSIQKALAAAREAKLRELHRCQDRCIAKPKKGATETQRVQALIAAKGRCAYYKCESVARPALWTAWDRILLPPCRGEEQKARKDAWKIIRKFQKELRASATVETALAAVRKADLRELHRRVARVAKPKPSPTETERVQALLRANGGCYLSPWGSFKPEVNTRFDRICLPCIRPQSSSRGGAEKARKLAWKSIRDFKSRLRAGTSIQETLVAMRKAAAVQRAFADNGQKMKRPKESDS